MKPFLGDWICGGMVRLREILYNSALFWAIYNDLSRGHPKWWFSKGSVPQNGLKLG